MFAVSSWIQKRASHHGTDAFNVKLMRIQCRSSEERLNTKLHERDSASLVSNLWNDKRDCVISKKVETSTEENKEVRDQDKLKGLLDHSLHVRMKWRLSPLSAKWYCG